MQDQHPQTPLAAPVGPLIFDVCTPEFEELVVKPSFERPVLVDFWAPWCGPCKQLMPVLEKVVTEAGGAVVMAKVNLDENQDLAQALKIQSVPAVFGFFQGRPIDAFQGVLREGQIKAFIDKLVQTVRQAQPDAIDIPEELKAAAESLAAGDLDTAHQIYAQILSQDEKNASAYAGLVRVLIAAGQAEKAAQLIENAPEEISGTSEFGAAKTALELAQGASDTDLSALEAKIVKNPKDHAARIELAQGLFGCGQKTAAAEHLLESIEIDVEWNDALARKTLLQFFEALGHSDPLTVASRKKLSTILFS